MKKRIQLMWLVFGLLSLTTACQKEEIPVYTDVNKVNFDYSAMNIQTVDGVLQDTLNFDMGFTIEEFVTVNLEFILIGYASEQEREVGISITGDTEFVGSILEMPEKVVCPANKVKFTVPCVIHVNDELIAGEKIFGLKLIDSKDLLAGNRTTVCLKASADVPANWVGDERWYGNKIENFFGTCTKAKYRFVYAVLGVWDFSNWNGTGFSSFMGDAGKFKPANRLLKQELEKRGPIEDPESETGFVTFPDL